MNKPAITSELLVQLTSAAPARVQKRLDKNPQAANEWNWAYTQENPAVITVDTGSQVVTLTPSDGVLNHADQVKCDCLLAPKCLHLLACVTLLEIEQSESSSLESDVEETVSDDADSNVDSNADSSSDQTLVLAAADLFYAAGQVVVTGFGQASSVMIGQLIQAAHHARAVGLHWPAAAAIRVVEGIRQQRTEARGADIDVLRRDMYELLSSTRMIQQQTAGWQSLIGTARRKYHPHDEALSLQGVFVEPILTDSGYAGMVVYLKDDADRWFTISDVRLGDAERLAGVWKGGIPIGNKTATANELVGGQLLIRGGGISDDGRLGLGSKTELALSSSNEWLSESLRRWLATDLSTQLRRVWKNRYTPELARPAGWDLVGMQVEIVGARGQFLIVRVLDANQNAPIHVPLGIQSENIGLEYRRNLQRLAAGPGMLLNVIARFDFARPVALFPIAIAPIDEAEVDGTDAVDELDEPQPSRPRLVLPESANGCWQLGWQRLQPEHFSRTCEPVPLTEEVWASQGNEILEPMQRRLQAMLQGGHHSIPDLSSDSLQIDAARYLEAWYETAAVLLMELSTASATLRTTETKRETAKAIQRLTELWIAGEAWCDNIGLAAATRQWVPGDTFDS